VTSTTINTSKPLDPTVPPKFSLSSTAFSESKKMKLEDITGDAANKAKKSSKDGDGDDDEYLILNFN
jgi:hypothetical protein